MPSQDPVLVVRRETVPISKRCRDLWQKPWFPFAVIGLVCAILWSRTVFFGFVWDDKFFIQNLESIRSLRHLPEIFYSLDAQSSFPEGFKLFRPLRTVQYALLYLLAGQPEPQPWIFHLANIVWHCAAAMLFYQTCLGLFRLWAPRVAPASLQAAALFAALGFAVHPVVTEVVCWAKSLDDAMAATFALAAIVALLPAWRQVVRVECDSRAGMSALPVTLQEARHNPRVGWAVFWYIMAVYSKISAAPLALLIYPLLRLGHRLDKREALRKTLPFIAAAAVFMVHRRWVIGQSAQTAPISGTYLQTLVDTIATAPTYLRLVLGVPPFFIDYSFLPGGLSLFSPGVLAGACLAGGMVVIAIWSWRREPWHFLSFGLCWFGFFMLPVSNLLPMMQYMAERFLYLPIFGFFIVAAFLWMKISRRALASAGAASLLLTWSILSWDRALIWKDEITLFVTSSQQGKKIPRVEQNAVAAIFELPSLRGLFLLDAKSHKLIPIAAVTPANRAAAEQTLNQAREWFPKNVQVLSASALFYVQIGGLDTAERLFLAVCAQDSANSDAWANLGEVQVSQGRSDDAISAFGKSLALNPNQLEALRGSSSVYWRKEDYKRAIEALEKLKKLEPNNTNDEYWLEQARHRLGGDPKTTNGPQ